MELVTQNWLFRKGDFFQEIPAPKKIILPKKLLFGRSTCFEKVRVLNLLEPDVH